MERARGAIIPAIMDSYTIDMAILLSSLLMVFAAKRLPGRLSRLSHRIFSFSRAERPE